MATKDAAFIIHDYYLSICTYCTLRFEIHKFHHRPWRSSGQKIFQHNVYFIYWSISLSFVIRFVCCCYFFFNQLYMFLKIKDKGKYDCERRCMTNHPFQKWITYGGYATAATERFMFSFISIIILTFNLTKVFE